MKVHVIHDNGAMRVHAVGCKDVARELRKAISSDWQEDVIEGLSVGDSVAANLNKSFGWSPDDGESPPWSASDLKVLPCCGRK